MSVPLPDFSRVKRGNLADFITGDLWAGHSARANLKKIEIDGQRYVVKDFGGKGLLARAGLGRFLIGHEWRIYKVLDGVPGIPRVFHRIDPEAFIMEYVEGTALKDLRHEPVSGDFVRRLEELVRAMHSRGVLHLDLHQRRNIIVGKGDMPFLVDFATSIYVGRSAFAGEVLVPVFGKFDASGVLKIKKWHAPDLFSEKEIRTLRRMERLRRLWIFTPVHVSKRKPPCPLARK